MEFLFSILFNAGSVYPRYCLSYEFYFTSFLDFMTFSIVVTNVEGALHGVFQIDFYAFL